MSYLELAEQCVLYSASKEFSRTTWDTAPIRLYCMQREISELRDEIKTGNVRGQSLESADVAIYAIVVMADLGNTCWTVRSRMHCGPPAICAPDEMVAPLRHYVDLAFEAWRLGNQGDVCLSLGMLIAQIVDVRVRCLRLTNSLQEDCSYKLAIMRSRERCHGNKDPRS
jgi:hypothetical protein